MNQAVQALARTLAGGGRPERGRVVVLLVAGGIALAAVLLIGNSLGSPGGAASPAATIYRPATSVLDIVPAATVEPAGQGLYGPVLATPPTPPPAPEPIPELFSAAALIDLGSKLAIVIGLIYGVVWLLKRASRGRLSASHGEGGLELLDTLSLGNHRTIHLVRAGGKTFVVGATAGSISSLGELDPPLAPGAWDQEPWQLQGRSVADLERLLHDTRN